MTFALKCQTKTKSKGLHMEIAAVIVGLVVFFGITKMLKQSSRSVKNDEANCHSIRNIRYGMMD